MTYATVQEVVEFLGIGQDVVNETVGTGDGTTTKFYLSKSKIVTGSETIRVDGVVQTITTHYTIDYDTGLITFVVAPILNKVIAADFMACPIKSSVLSKYIDIIEEEDIKQGLFLLRKDEVVSKDSYDRYYLTFRFLADSNLSGTVNKDDLIVYEYNNEVKVDITEQVNEVETDRSFFKLADGYPTEERSVMVTYRYAKYPIEEILNDLKAFVTAGVAKMIFSMPKASEIFGGISNWSVNGVSIGKGAPSAMEAVIKGYDRIFQEKAIKIKPLKTMAVGDGFQFSGAQYTRYRDAVPSRLVTRGTNLSGIIIWGGFRFSGGVY